jgi:phosphate transport system substrate-binding protein
MIRLAGTAVLVLALAAPPARAAPPTIDMSGSSAAQPVLADLAYFYGRTRDDPPRFTIVGGGSSIGVADAARGVVDAGMVSRELTSSDPPGLVLTRIAISGVCLVTNRANPVPNLSRAQVQDLIANRLTNWSQVPGSPRTDAIAAATLDVTAGARQVFEQIFVDPATPFAYTPRTFSISAQVRDYVEATPNAWGYADFGLTAGVHAVRYEGVPCTRATIRSGAYPAHRPLGVVTRGRPKGALARFLRWIAISPKARAVIASRYIPVQIRSGSAITSTIAGPS